ncbi:MAG: DUF4296 domain-containing protein [Bacteroidaceae bacterium]|nr:DUF4296 domain-containing protein [Bacteroidaceae bacterium]
MEDILLDYHLAQAMAEVQPGELQENRYLLTQAALKKHRVTEAQFDTSLVYWCRNSEKMVKICERVSKRLTYMAESQGVERKEKSPYSYLATEGDTANVWNLRENVVIIPNVVDNIYSFSIDADSTYYPGDYFMWAFNTQFLSEDNNDEAYALLSVRYDNDSIAGTGQRLTSDRQVEVRLNCPSGFRDVPIRSVEGTIYMPVRSSGFGILAVSNFVLVHYHDLSREHVAETPSDTIVVDTASVVPLLPDTVHTRRTPYSIREGQADKHTIDIVKDKPVRAVRRRR